MPVKNVTELDYADIRENLRVFLQNQDEFSDYSFEASGLSTLVDLLAYNTHYNAVLAHMVANEAFLDSAVRRNSVVSIAKTMGYTPRSTRSSVATINLTVRPPASYTSSTLQLPRDSVFSSTVNGKSRSFVPQDDYTVTKSVVDGVSAFRFENIRLVEGTRTTTSQIITNTTTSGPIVLENDNIDTTTIRVKVQTSTRNASTETFNIVDNVLDVTSTSKVFYLDERTDGHYQIVFGDDVLGKSLEVGNIVIVDYVVSNGADGNGARVFNYPSVISAVGESVSSELISASAGGFAAETADSIRFNAPRFNASKGRTITKTDYESTIKQSNPNIKSVAVWGGEDNIPPIYGKVFISMQPQDNFVITEDDKKNIRNSVLNNRMPIGLTPEFVDPEYVYIGINANVTYDQKLTTLSADSLKSLIVQRTENHFETNVNALKKNFYYSRLTKDIDAISESIVATGIEMRLIKKLNPVLGRVARYEPKFNNKILPLSIRSNYFTADLNGSKVEVLLCDKPNPDVIAPVYSGQGILQLKTKVRGEIVDKNVGTIDYDTGVLDIVDLRIDSISGAGNSVFRVVSTPHESSKNISTDILVRTTEEADYAVFAQPARNIILKLDDAAEDVANNIRKGLNVTMVPRVRDE